MNFLGVNLCGPGITLVEAAFQPENPRDPIRVQRTKSPPHADAAGPPLWESLRDSLRLRPGPELARAGEWARRLLTGTLAQAPMLRGLFDESGAATHRVVVYPYRTPPVLRKHFYDMFHDSSVPLFGLEAPVALALEAVARGACALPAHLLLVTGAGAARELTAARVAAVPGRDPDQERLRVEVQASFAAGSPDEIESARPSLQALCGRAGNDWRLVSDSPDDLAAALGIPTRERAAVLDGASPAVLGAIRFAGVIRGGPDLPLLGRYSSPVDVRGVCPASVGVVGTNGHDEWYWYRLFPAGAALPTPDELVQSSSEGPRSKEDLLLAECLGPRHRNARWLHQDDWEAAGLSLHDYSRASTRPGPLNPAPEPGHYAWTFRLKGRDENEPWGRLPWVIQFKDRE